MNTALRVSLSVVFVSNKWKAQHSISFFFVNSRIWTRIPRLLLSHSSPGNQCMKSIITYTVNITGEKVSTHHFLCGKAEWYSCSLHLWLRKRSCKISTCGFIQVVQFEVTSHFQVCPVKNGAKSQVTYGAKTVALVVMEVEEVFPGRSRGEVVGEVVRGWLTRWLWLAVHGRPGRNTAGPPSSASQPASHHHHQGSWLPQQNTSRPPSYATISFTCSQGQAEKPAFLTQTILQA